MTERDQFVQSQVQGMLQPGEQIRSIAYILRAPGIAMQILLTMICFWLYFFQVKHYYAALTDRRIILIKTSSGFFRPQIKNAGVEEVSLAGVQNVTFSGFANNKSFTLHRAGGTEETFRIGPMGTLCERQGSFMQDVEATVKALPAG
ncbi:MAG: hypothetical protein AB7S26_32385 [Sandaracinaceae bacterium]